MQRSTNETQHKHLAKHNCVDLQALYNVQKSLKKNSSSFSVNGVIIIYTFRCNFGGCCCFCLPIWQIKWEGKSILKENNSNSTHDSDDDRVGVCRRMVHTLNMTSGARRKVRRNILYCNQTQHLLLLIGFPRIKCNSPGLHIVFCDVIQYSDVENDVDVQIKKIQSNIRSLAPP